MENQTEEIKKKEFSFRGKSIEDLKKLDIREFAKLLRSNERRTILRQSDRLQKFVLLSKQKFENKKPIRTHLRDIVIVPQMVGWTIQIHNGKEFSPIEIIGEMLGHRLGEFSATRQKVKHGAAGIGATRSSASASVK
ncbi:MAG: 30S ribosomal protein S19 [Candidatus Nanoarchaeia archaeon]